MKIFGIIVIIFIGFLSFVYISQRYQSAEDRFSTFILNPVPSSVVNLECIEDWSSADPQYFFTFDFNQELYSALLESRKFRDSSLDLDKLSDQIPSSLAGKEYFDDTTGHFHYIVHDSSKIYYLVTTT